MAVTQIADIVVPAEFTAYQVQNSLVSTALFTSGVAVKNGEMESQLQAGAQSFTVPYWNDPADGGEADITNDDPTILSTQLKFTTGKQVVRKAFLHQSPARVHRRRSEAQLARCCVAALRCWRRATDVASIRLGLSYPTRG